MSTEQKRAVAQDGHILMTVSALHAETGVPVLESSVVVAAWRADPARFGLRGYAEVYPNSQLVSARLTRLVSQGYLRRPAKGAYEPTDAGRRRVEHLNTAGAIG